VAAYDYHHEDGRYSCSKLKGVRAGGEKAFLTGRLLKGSDLEVALMEWPHQFYRYPGLTYYMKGSDGQPDLLYRLPELLQSGAR